MSFYFQGHTLVAAIVVIIYPLMKSATCLPIKGESHDEPWIHPCGFEITGSSQSGKHLASILDTLTARAKNAHLELEAVRKEYIAPVPTSRIGSDPQMIGFLDNIHIEAFPHIPSEQDITNSLKEKVLDLFLENYDNISAAFVFIEQTKINESNAENGEFSENFNLIESHLKILLCELDVAIKGLFSSTIPTYVSRTIMPDFIRLISNKTERRNRDYIIVKDAMALTDAFHVQFKRQLENELAV